MSTWGRKPSCTCGECRRCKHAAYMREWYRKKSPEERRAWVARRSAERVRRDDAARHPRRMADPETRLKLKANWTVRNAVRDGRLGKGPCEACGTELRVQGHHDNYDKPLEVRWLCTTCHAVEHNPQARVA